MINKSHEYMLLETGKILLMRYGNGELKDIVETGDKAYVTHYVIDFQEGVPIPIERRDEILATGRSIAYLQNLKKKKFKERINDRHK